MGYVFKTLHPRFTTAPQVLSNTYTSATYSNEFNPSPEVEKKNSRIVVSVREEHQKLR